MKKPHFRRKALERGIGTRPEGVDISEVALRVRYIGSPEHKKTTSFAGRPRPRYADANICDDRFASQQKEIEGWLRKAIRDGNFSDYWDRNRFPRYVWYKQGDLIYEARHSGNGAYHGYHFGESDPKPRGL